MLNEHGFELVERVVEERLADALRDALFRTAQPGTRCLLDLALVRETAVAVRTKLAGMGRLPAAAVAIQAIAFDKTAGANWKVTWHQDLMFPFARPVRSEGFAVPARKHGVDYARPPASVLEALTAVRVHLDDCGADNGPLRVSPGTQRQGIIPSAAISETVTRNGERTCLAKAGDALLMKPLLLHASSPARIPGHRRVLHLVYHSGGPLAEPWHREV